MGENNLRIDPFEFINKEEKIYSRKELLIKLYDLPKISDCGHNILKKIRGDKYVELALKYDYSNYKIGTVSDILSMGLAKSMSIYAKKFLGRSGIFLCVFNTLSDKKVSCIFRKINDSEIMEFSYYPCVYGLDLVDTDFKYGDYLLVTEGVYDADSFRPLFKNSVAVLTSSASVMASEILCSITNKFILAFDNDTAGNEGFKRTRESLLTVNKSAVVEKLNIYPGDKDLGNMEEHFLYSDSTGYNSRKEYYLSALKIIVSDNILV